MKKMDLFKIGMYLGMGAAVGKWFGECISAALEGVSLGVIAGLAGCGNKRAQEVCDAHGLDYKKFEEEHETEPDNVQPIWTNLHDINEKKEENKK